MLTPFKLFLSVFWVVILGITMISDLLQSISNHNLLQDNTDNVGKIYKFCSNIVLFPPLYYFHISVYVISLVTVSYLLFYATIFKWEKTRFIYFLPPHKYSLPHKWHYSPEWYICYQGLTYIDTSKSPKVYGLSENSLLVYILCVWTNV